MRERRFGVEIFLVSFAVLLLQISYTRIFSFKISSYFTYLVIGFAMLGIGSGGVLLAVSERLRRIPLPRLLAGLGSAGGAAVGIGYAVVAAVELSLGEPATSPGQVLRLAAVCAVLTAGFLAMGIAVAAILSSRPESAGRLYAADLAGAATGCALSIPLIEWLTPPGCVFASGALLALAGTGLGSRMRPAWPALLAAATLALLAAVGGRLPDPVVDPAKSMGRDQLAGLGTSVFHRWNPVFRVDVIERSSQPDLKILAHDGLWGSALWRFDAAKGGAEVFDRSTRSLPFSVANPRPRVLVIGAAGGFDLRASLHFGASQVTGVELNPVTVSLLEDRFAEFTGHLARDERVRLVNAEGRAFLRNDPARYDLIYFVAPDSFATMNAAQASGFVLAESYLYTVETLSEALEHLSPGGIIAAQFGEADYGRPLRTPRYLASARRAFEELGIRDFARHVLLSTSRDFSLLQTSTILLQADPFSEAQKERFLAAAREVPDTSVRHVPGRARERGVIGGVIELREERLAALLSSYPYQVGPIYDDSPYFWHFARFRDVLAGEDLEMRLDPAVARGESALLVMLALSAFFALVLLILPFASLRGGWRQLPGKRASGAYFAALGLGFMGYEVSLIQKLTLFLGYPTRSLSVTLFALLLSSGIGSRWSVRHAQRPGEAAPRLVAALALVTAFHTFGMDAVMHALGGAPLGLRIAVAVAAIAPLGLVLGAFLPLGIAGVAAACEPRARTQIVAWCWAVNGFFSVLGSLLVTLGSMTWGFRAMLLAAFALYAVAGALLRAISPRLAQRPGPPETQRSSSGSMTTRPAEPAAT
jgi:spermidine synthase